MTVTAIKDAATGFTLSYGSVTFGPLCRYRLTGTPEYDPAGRTVKFIRYRLSVSSYEYASDPGSLSTNMLAKRRALLEPGSKLVINDIGWGDTNTRTNHAEYVWGPRPLQADFTPLGGGICWQLDWECEFCVTECNGSAGKLSKRPFVMFNYEAIYSNDEQGFTTRQLTGVVSIPQGRNTTTSVKDYPVLHRDGIQVSVPYGFRRIQNEWHENAAQNELSFGIVDRQLDHDPFPPGINDAEIQFAISSAKAVVNVNYGFAISGMLETLPGWPKEHAAVVMIEIMRAKVNALIATLPGAFIKPETIEMSYDIFRRRSSFSYTFQILGAPVNSINRTNVLYSRQRDIYDVADDYKAWVNGNQDGPALSTLWGNRGQTNLITRPLSGIVDLCHPSTFVYLGNNQSAPVRPKLSYPRDVLPKALFDCSYVDEKNSWVAYEATAQFIRKNNLRVNKRDEVIPPPVHSGREPKEALHIAGYRPYSPYPGSATIVYNGAPEQLLIIKGKGVRVRFPVSIPALKSVNGVVLDVVNSGEEGGLGPSIGGCPTYYGRFIWVYRPRSFLNPETFVLPHPQIEFAKK